MERTRAKPAAAAVNWSWPAARRGRILADAYAAMDVFAFSSQSETQGMVLAEAMAAGVPAVALDGPGVREIVNDDNGRLLRGRRFGRGICRALDRSDADRERLQQLGRGSAEVGPRVQHRKLRGSGPGCLRGVGPRYALTVAQPTRTRGTGSCGGSKSNGICSWRKRQRSWRRHAKAMRRRAAGIIGRNGGSKPRSGMETSTMIRAAQMTSITARL